MTRTLTIPAHSLGNMVASSVVQDHGYRPAKYFMLNAAVPAEAFDATQWNTNALNNPFEFEDWVGYPAKSWASCWQSLFPANDIRGKLTWKGRFTDVPQLTTLFNYYSTGDEVLSIYDNPVFNHEPTAILSCNLQQDDIDELLAKGVPALSNPMGSGSAQEISGVNAQDLDEYSSAQNWPRILEPKWKGWWHSDIKDVAFPFVRDVFDSLKGDNTP